MPVVFLTAYSDVDTVERARVVQPYGYIVKPFDPRELHTTIEMALHKGNVDRRLRQSRENMQTILDARGRVRFASQAALGMAKAFDQEAVGHGLADLLPLFGRKARSSRSKTFRRKFSSEEPRRIKAIPGSMRSINSGQP